MCCAHGSPSMVADAVKPHEASSSPETLPLLLNPLHTHIKNALMLNYYTLFIGCSVCASEWLLRNGHYIPGITMYGLD